MFNKEHKKLFNRIKKVFPNSFSEYWEIEIKVLADKQQNYISFND